MSRNLIDHVEYIDKMGTEEFSGYLKTEHTVNCFVWVWANEVIRIPAHRIKRVVTYIGEEE
jgi:hypothetical protein